MFQGLTVWLSGGHLDFAGGQNGLPVRLVHAFGHGRGQGVFTAGYGPQSVAITVCTEMVEAPETTRRWNRFCQAARPRARKSTPLWLWNRLSSMATATTIRSFCLEALYHFIVWSFSKISQWTLHAQSKIRLLVLKGRPVVFYFIPDHSVFFSQSNPRAGYRFSKASYDSHRLVLSQIE